MTIGIIEDDRLLSRSLKVVLEKEGYRTLQVYTKKDAGQILQGTEELLLVDIGLPDGNGISLCIHSEKRQCQGRMRSLLRQKSISSWNI